MSRHGYNEDCDGDYLAVYRWRGQVASAIRGKRGQAFLRDLIESLDAMPVRQLITKELVMMPPSFIPPSAASAQVCAIGSVGVRRGIAMETLDPENYDRIANVFDIAHQLVCEIEFVNDEGGVWKETPEQRWQRVRAWAVAQLKKGQ